MNLPVDSSSKSVAPWVFRTIVSKLVYYSGIIWLYKQLHRLGKRDNNILILAYHRVNDFENDVLDMAISPNTFEEQIKYLQRHYHILSLDEAVKILKESDKIPEKAVVLTFDDGYKDNFDLAFPIVKKYHIPITVFVSVGDVESSKPFWWDQIINSVYDTNKIGINLNSFGLGEFKLRTKAEKRVAVHTIINKLKEFVPSKREKVIKHFEQLLQTNSSSSNGSHAMKWTEIEQLQRHGITIGSHGLSHTILSRLNNSIAEFEICESKEILEKRLHSEIQYFAYPNGRPEDLNDRIIKTLKKAGYTAACTWIHGYNDSDNIDSFFKLKRVAVSKDICTGIFGKFSKSLFETELSGFFDVLMLRGMRGAF